MKVLTAAAAAALDRRIIEEIGLPGAVLMENAATGLLEAFFEAFPSASSAAIFCGPGNNGGDGFALGRRLASRGVTVDLFVARDGRPFSADTAEQARVCHALGMVSYEVPNDQGQDQGEGKSLDSPDASGEEGESLELPASPGPEEPRTISLEQALHHAAEADVIVDALFGTGLSRPLQGFFAELVDGLGGLSRPILAVDLPSGLDGSRPDPIGPHLSADLTVTFAAPKIAHVLAPACDAMGEVVVAELGYPPRWIEGAAGDVHLLVADELLDWWVERPLGGHKGRFGHVLIVAGSAGFSGAALLAARGAVRGGAGLVTLAVPAALAPAADAACLEAMVVALPGHPAGGLEEGAAESVKALAEDRGVLAVGPGLGRSLGAVREVRELVLAVEKPLVLDADGLNAFGGDLASLRSRKAATILTPHPGELARLLGVETAEVQKDRLAALRSAVRESGAVVVLKGRQTLVGVPLDDNERLDEPNGIGGIGKSGKSGESGESSVSAAASSTLGNQPEAVEEDVEIWINPTGGPLLGTGGTGDVLTGLIAALLAQGHSPWVAAALGVFLHGRAADDLEGSLGDAGLMASELADELPRARRRWIAAETEVRGIGGG